MDTLELIRNKQRMIYDVPLKHVRIITKNRLLVDGQEAMISNDAWNDLCAITGVNNSSVSAIDQIGDGIGAETVNLVMKALGDNRNVQTSFVFDGSQISRIARPQKSAMAMTPDRFANIIEFMIDKKDDLHLDGVAINTDGTKAVVKLLQAEEYKPHMPGEDFRVGRALEWDMLGGTSIQHYLHRMVCSNGAIARIPLRATQLLTVKSSAEEWYSALFNDVETKDIAERYIAAMSKGMETKMSVREYQNVQAALFGRYKEDIEIIASVFSDTQWMRDYTEIGIESFEDIKSDRLKNYPAPYYIADAVNLLTDLASHQYSSIVPDYVRANDQSVAGKLLYGKHDADQWVTNLPKFVLN